MKPLLPLILTVFSLTAFAQNSDKPAFERKGLIFGAAFGVSAIRLNRSPVAKETQASISFPNLKIGAMVSKRTAILLYLPGTIYTQKSPGRERDRGFEAIVPSIQYWVKDKWWLSGGVGLGLDAPAFYDIKNESERKFYFGTSAVIGSGYELCRKGRFALDIQNRIQYGKVNLPSANQTGLAYSVLVGFNFY